MARRQVFRVDVLPLFAGQQLVHDALLMHEEVDLAVQHAANEAIELLRKEAPDSRQGPWNQIVRSTGEAGSHGSTYVHLADSFKAEVRHAGIRGASKLLFGGQARNLETEFVITTNKAYNKYVLSGRSAQSKLGVPRPKSKYVFAGAPGGVGKVFIQSTTKGVAKNDYVKRAVSQASPMMQKVFSTLGKEIDATWSARQIISGPQIGFPRRRRQISNVGLPRRR